MEGIHGVDVSWLHHSNKDVGQKSAKSSEVKEISSTDPASVSKSNPSTKSNGLHHSHMHNPLHKSHLDHGVSPKDDSTTISQSTQAVPQASSPTPSSRSPKESRLGLSGRRGSWMTSLSSKFSSTSSTTAPASTQETTTASKGLKSPQNELPNPFATHTMPKEVKKAEAPVSTPPGSPKAPHTFLQSALRRLSSTGGSSMGRSGLPGSGGICPRKTMNVDPYRERCALPELDQNKLRRVSFCVDVEIAGSAQYVDDLPEDSNPTPSIDAPSSLSKLSKDLESKKSKDQRNKDQKLKRSEGEALKRPEAVSVEKEEKGAMVAGTETSNPVAEDALNGSLKDPPTKKKEKKKRSESERKERKERKQREAIANGTLPAEITNNSSGTSTPGSDTPSRSQDRPTTDPLRIYRRCCQLRETSIVKKIVEQISPPSACSVGTPGILSCLDLSGYHMQLPDIVTLGDYLAVVPVKKLIMEDCGLGDEAVRVLLAGLLAAKTSEQAKYNKKLGKRPKRSDSDLVERLGVVEKVSFKNNPKVGKHGWRHVMTFIYMSRSLKAIDLSMIPFPPDFSSPSSISRTSSTTSPKEAAPAATTPTAPDMSNILAEAIGSRLAGKQLEELVLGECELSTPQIGQIVDASIKCGATRLGLASNDLSKESIGHILRYVRSGVCWGLDLGGNDMTQYVDMLADAIEPHGTLWALSLADCQLVPSALERLLPALAKLENFRFLDLSHNRDLFATKPSALVILRRYLPQLVHVKRLHLADVDMTSEHTIALADTLPECKSLAHLNLLENRHLAPLASAKTEAEQEEACALYASLMAAVRVSETLIAVDIDVPSPESSEIVKALAKQVVAYSLRNLERMPETSDSAIASLREPHENDQQSNIPDVLLHIVGQMDGYPEDQEGEAPAPDNDYIVGGTGVVKALDICLNRAERIRKDSADASPLQSGTGTPKPVIQEGDITKRKAKEMSKNLLGSARKIRARLQPALVKESKSGDYNSYRRLQFLDSTLRGMIDRFEDEYPETRIKATVPSTNANDENQSETSSLSPQNTRSSPAGSLPTNASSANVFGVFGDADADEDELDPTSIKGGRLSRRPSSPSLANEAYRQAAEEGRVHRLGQRIKRDILPPEVQDYAHGVTGMEDPEPEHVQQLRRMVEGFAGNELHEQINRLGPEGVYQAIRALREGKSKGQGQVELSEELELWSRLAEEQSAERKNQAKG